ncbi:MAG: MBL fold metallo-hydrolase [Desulforhopalus sp.]|nr:MBL fold metallo-hydrolase [Desulforhopalus sp.]
MNFSVLGSGSKGNCVYVESGETAVFIDAGFSGRQILLRLGAVGRDASLVRAICLTHEHSDHINGAGIISRKLEIPVYGNKGTLKNGRKKMGRLFRTVPFETGEHLEIGALSIHSFAISHDTADPVGFVVSDGKSSLGYLTDTGKTTCLMDTRLAACNGLILEFNHDLEMLKNGPYPLPLQQRVRSSRGHLCNEDAAEFLAGVQSCVLRHVVLAHLSEKNNLPRLAQQAAGAVLNAGVELHTASQSEPLAMITL